MIPIEGNINNKKIKMTSYPSLSYKLKEDKKKIEQYIDGIEAVKQSIYKILMTERYKYEIYDWNYGIELNNLLGSPKEYVYAELERRIQDALITDDRIKQVYDFKFPESKKDRKTTVLVEFKVLTNLNETIDINAPLEVK